MKRLGKFYYSVDDNNCVFIYGFNNADKPFVRQPHWPNSDPFDTAADAEQWAIETISHMIDRSLPLARASKGAIQEVGTSLEEYLANKIKK